MPQNLNKNGKEDTGFYKWRIKNNPNTEQESVG